jgi:hypothetical protein
LRPDNAGVSARPRKGRDVGIFDLQQKTFQPSTTFRHEVVSSPPSGLGLKSYSGQGRDFAVGLAERSNPQERHRPTARAECARIVRHGRAEAIIGADDRLYCHRTSCEEIALLSHIEAVRPVGAVARAA